MTNSTTTRSSNILTATTVVLLACLLGLALAIPMQARAALLTQQLQLGMANSEVTSLQTFLAADPAVYPQGLVTGYYGFLTKSAVSNFQSKNGIDPVGRVGPITLVAINSQMGGVSDGSIGNIEGAGKVVNYGIPQPVISNVQVSRTTNSATITWNSSVPAVARVMYSTQWPFSYRTAQSVTNNSAASFAQSVTLTNLQSNTTYYFVAESLDSQGNFSWSSNGTSVKTQ